MASEIALKINQILKNIHIFILIGSLLSSCKKDQKNDVGMLGSETIKPTLSFVFVNRLGFRRDTSDIRWLQFVNLYDKVYNPETNISNLFQTRFSRYHAIVPLNDSIVLKTYEFVHGTQYAYEIKMGWLYHDVSTYREMRFQTKNWPNACDTIEFLRDTVIKFVYPDDTITTERFVRVQ